MKLRSGTVISDKVKLPESRSGKRCRGSEKNSTTEPIQIKNSQKNLDARLSEDFSSTTKKAVGHDNLQQNLSSPSELSDNFLKNGSNSKNIHTQIKSKSQASTSSDTTIIRERGSSSTIESSSFASVMPLHGDDYEILGQNCITDLTRKRKKRGKSMRDHVSYGQNVESCALLSETPKLHQDSIVDLTRKRKRRCSIRDNAVSDVQNTEFCTSLNDTPNLGLHQNSTVDSTIKRKKRKYSTRDHALSEGQNMEFHTSLNDTPKKARKALRRSRRNLGGPVEIVSLNLNESGKNASVQNDEGLNKTDPLSVISLGSDDDDDDDNVILLDNASFSDDCSKDVIIIDTPPHKKCKLSSDNVIIDLSTPISLCNKPKMKENPVTRRSRMSNKLTAPSRTYNHHVDVKSTQNLNSISDIQLLGTVNSKFSRTPVEEIEITEIKELEKQKQHNQKISPRHNPVSVIISPTKECEFINTKSPGAVYNTERDKFSFSPVLENIRNSETRKLDQKQNNHKISPKHNPVSSTLSSAKGTQFVNTKSQHFDDVNNRQCDITVPKNSVSSVNADFQQSGISGYGSTNPTSSVAPSGFNFIGAPLRHNGTVNFSSVPTAQNFPYTNFMSDLAVQNFALTNFISTVNPQFNAVGLNSTVAVERNVSLRYLENGMSTNVPVVPSLGEENKMNLENVPSPSVYGRNIYNPNPNGMRLGLRPVVIDGSNVAMGHGGGKFFSCKGLQICINYFLKRNHKVIAFVPHFRKCGGQTKDPQLLNRLENQGLVAFTPSRKVGKKWVVPYDDRYIVQYAAECGGVIVSTDNYRDLLQENYTWRETIENRLLMFTWVDDILMFPQDPLGKFGPNLERFLRFP